METIGDRLRRFIQRISVEASRTSGLVQAKMELNRLQQEMDERERVAGRKLSLLNRRGAVKDQFLLEAMKEELESLAECERRIEAALRRIQGLSITDTLRREIAEASAGGDDERESSLDSFEVS